jgi:hypothetical protein
MTKDQAIYRIQVAVSELRDYSASKGPLDRTLADEAISMLEEVMEAIQNRQLDQRHAVSVDSSSLYPRYRWG